MRYVLLVLIIGLAAVSSDLGPREQPSGFELQPVIFAAMLGSN